MKKELLNNFDAFRTWFNKMFSLSLNGKFCGLLRLKNWKHFAYKFYKYLSGRYRHVCEIITFTSCGQHVKLYNR